MDRKANNQEVPADSANKQNSSFDLVRNKLKGGRTGFLCDYDGTMSHPEKKGALVDNFEQITMVVREKDHEQSFNTGRPYNEMAQIYKNSGVSESFLKEQQDFYEYGATFRSPKTEGKETIVEGLELYEPIAKDIQKNIKGDIQAAIAAARQSDLQERPETIPEEAIKLLKQLNEKYPGSLDTIKVSCKTIGSTMHCYRFAINPDIHKEEKERAIEDLIYKSLTLIASNCLAKKPEYKAFKLADPKYTGIDIGLKEDINIKGGPPSKRTATDKFLRDGKFTNAIYFGDDKPDLEMLAEGQSHIQFNSIDEKAIKKKYELGETAAKMARGKPKLTPEVLETEGRGREREEEQSKLSPDELKKKRLELLTKFISDNKTKLCYQVFVAVKNANTPQEVLDKADIVAEGQNQARDLFRNLVMDPKFLPWDGF